MKYSHFRKTKRGVKDEKLKAYWAISKQNLETKELSDITVHMLLEDWKEKYRDAKAEWDKKPGWPAKLMNTSFCLYGTRYTIYPEDLGLGSDPLDEGFMMSIQKDLENDLLEAGASEISHSGEMD